MKKEDKKWLKQWEIATHNLTNVFTNRYFKNSVSDIYWVGDEVGGVLCVNDYFFDIGRICEAIRYNTSVKRLFEYYDKEIEFAMRDKYMPVNFKVYSKLGTFDFNKAYKEII